MVHIAFNNMKNSESVTVHINDLMDELLKITDRKFPFHIHLKKGHDNQHHVVLNCTYVGKALSSKCTHENLYKAISKSIHSMQTQIIRKSNKLGH